MNIESQKLLAKASRAIDAARHLLGAGHVDFAAGRAYYAMFYTAEAMLCERGLRFRKHGGVHAAFGEHLAKPGVMDPKYHRWLLDAFDQRIQGDYEVETTATPEDVEGTLTRADEFLEAARRLLE